MPKVLLKDSEKFISLCPLDPNTIGIITNKNRIFICEWINGEGCEWINGEGKEYQKVIESPLQGDTNGDLIKNKK